METSNPMATTSTSTFRLPNVKDSYILTKNHSQSCHDLASALINPKSSLSISYTKNLNEYPMPYTFSQKIPTKEDIRKYNEEFLSSKKKCLETSPEPPLVKSERVIKLPRIKLSEVRKGIFSETNWHNNDAEVNMPEEQKATRYSARPEGLNESWKTIFPTKGLPYNNIPNTTSKRFTVIDPKNDIELSNFIVNSTNAFKTEWSKRNGFKDRKFFPELHPEFLGVTKDNFRKRDDFVDYRENMLKVKEMMGGAWGTKK
ncbi:unnamed protein product [Blepharisma stoltei]|uniref:Uncharacterized protein n=1 Tax=Blepharisma stoltei TaxID=1481888 RepID=A0AAU9JUK1_9CILI|nr:unnamed protein product [Blepharisma stoltei]